MTTTISRRQFLRADIRGTHTAIRPPWALAEPDFLRACTRCDACIMACPEGILSKGDGGYPTVDFQHGACSFCQGCVAACEPGALRPPRPDNDARTAPWRLRAVIGEHCLARRGVVCVSCREHCEAGAIQLRPVVGNAAQPQLRLDRCTGCGACLQPCPVQAITVQAQPNEQSI